MNTAEGARALMTMVENTRGYWPEHHLVVMIDTIGRAVEGKENDTDTFRDFHAHTGIRLKREGVTYARTDHAGKDATKGQRGASGKGDDVDVVWRLEKTEHGVCLHRDLARMAWVPERVSFGLRDDPLRYEPIMNAWPLGTEDTAAALDRLGVSLGTSAKAAQKILREAGEPSRWQVVLAAARWRRQREGGPS